MELKEQEEPCLYITYLNSVIEIFLFNSCTKSRVDFSIRLTPLFAFYFFHFFFSLNIINIINETITFYIFVIDYI
jgi:hypothetical protein